MCVVPLDCTLSLLSLLETSSISNIDNNVFLIYFTAEFLISENCINLICRKLHNPYFPKID